METITVHVDDDFDLHKIATCGQCFRARRMDDGAYRFITRDQVVYIRDLGNGDFEVTCNPGTWDTGGIISSPRPIKLYPGRWIWRGWRSFQTKN